VINAAAYRFDLRTYRNVWSNAAALAWYGYSQAELHAMGDRLLETLVHQDDVVVATQHLEQCRRLHLGGMLCYSIRVWPKTGLHPLFCRTCHACVEVEGGECVAVEGYLHEISTQEFNTRKLLEREVPAGGMVLHYQPICDLRTGELRGYEALARLKRGDEFHLPYTFLPYLDGDLERLWVTQQLEQIGAALDALPPDLWVSFNACPTVISSGLLEQLLEGHRHVSRIGLEVLESIHLGDTAILEHLQSIKCLGITLRADDVGDPNFGGLDRILRHDLFSAVKIDGNLTRRVLSDQFIGSVVQHLLAICAEAKLVSIAEWVETESQSAWLLRHGCQLGQGMLFGLAVPWEKIAKTKPLG
jgi:EAL domain-containing protein (putative c-di-GMP-specific phosphodiesterase class I)